MNFKLYDSFPTKHLNWNDYRGEEFKRYGDGLVYYNIKSTKGISGILFSLNPEDVKWVEIKGDVRPHRDHGVKTAINIYVDPMGARTTFWKVKEGAKASLFPGEVVPSLYMPHQLEEMDSFVAQRGEAYCMDLTQVHTVTGGAGLRRFIQLSWSNKTIHDIMPEP